jgi:hypothetical protein
MSFTSTVSGRVKRKKLIKKLRIQKGKR